MSSFISDYNYSNLSFSGCDMVATINMVLPNGTSISRAIGSLQTLTYSIHMDKHPVRSLGNANAKDYVFGPRTIAGTLIFAVFHKHFAYEILDTLKDSAGVQNYHLLTDELPPFDITIQFRQRIWRYRKTCFVWRQNHKRRTDHVHQRHLYRKYLSVCCDRY